MPTLSIGQLAKSAHIGVSTIHYYEKQGLLPKAVRRASGYRQYQDADLRRLHFICRAKRLGFSLEEIGELLLLQTQSKRGVEKAKIIAKKKLIDVEDRIAELQRLRTTLAALVAACPGHGHIDQCPILRTFDNSMESTL